jgi:cystathionine beta-lyase
MDKPRWHPDTLMVHADLDWQPAPGFKALSTPVHRASTVVFEDAQGYLKRRERGDASWLYGTIATPTTRTLEHQINLTEGALDTCLAPSGLGAVTLVYLALLKAGDHVLVPSNVYDPSRFFANALTSKFGIACTFYDPLDLGALPGLFQSQTRLIWVETPGSLTFEVADLPAISAIARARGCVVAADNTWSAGRFLKALDLGADVSVQALTKYQGGHGDLVMGSVSCRDDTLKKALRSTRDGLGFAVSGDDASLVLRGLQTMGLRLDHYQAAALEIARFLADHPMVARVLHPALSSCPGHEVWKRDFSGSSSVFSFEFVPEVSGLDADRFVDSLQLFRIGASWGGTTSLALHIEPYLTRGAAPGQRFAGQLVRLNIGLEHVADLRVDLEQGLSALTRQG